MARLSVLDQSPVRSGAKPADAIRETLALAEACDRLGYTRYWLAEHHSTPAPGRLGARDPHRPGGRAHQRASGSARAA